MISESVYYMDRSHGALVTDRQVVVDGRSYDLALIKDARIKSKHPSGSTGIEFYLRGLSVVTLVAAMGIKLFFWGSDFTQALFGLDMCLFTVSLLGLLLFGAVGTLEHTVLLRKLNGTSEELFCCVDRRYAQEFAQAVRDAANDYQAGHGANARGVYRK